MSIARRSTLAACAIALTMGTGAAFAAEASQAAYPAPSKEAREKMATMHEQMATCLRSDKLIATCHEEMMKSCHDTMGDKGCPMMGPHDHMMKDHPMGAMAPK
jgi:transcriptional antiterminator Rof (Rho-off)